MNTVINKDGASISYDDAVQLMDKELLEEIHLYLAPCSDQEFFDEYAKRHNEKFDKEFGPTRNNYCW